MSTRIPVPYIYRTLKAGNQTYYVGLSIYSNLLHIIVTSNGKPGVCAEYIPHSKLGDNPLVQFTIHPLIGVLPLQYELLIKQIASTTVIAQEAIPFICNILIPDNICREDFMLLVNQLKSLIQENDVLIKKSFHPFLS